MTEPTKQKFDKERFKLAAEQKKDETIALLKEQMNFNAEHLTQILKENTDLTAPFFSTLIGEPVDVENEAHITRILEAGVKDADSIADVMYFLYVNFGSKAEATTATEAPDPPVRKKTAWKDMEVPFKEGTKQHACFVEMQKFDGTSKEFVVRLEKVFAERNIQTNSIETIFSITYTNARERGWDVRLRHGDAKKLYVAKLP